MSKENPGLPEGKVEYGCSAVVTITLKVYGKGHWGGEATVAEVMRIGGREVMSTIDEMVGNMRKDHVRVERIGEPEVGAITWGRGTK